MVDVSIALLYTSSVKGATCYAYGLLLMKQHFSSPLFSSLNVIFVFGIPRKDMWSSGIFSQLFHNKIQIGFAGVLNQYLPGKDDAQVTCHK